MGTAGRQEEKTCGPYVCSARSGRGWEHSGRAVVLHPVQGLRAWCQACLRKHRCVQEGGGRASGHITA